MLIKIAGDTVFIDRIHWRDRFREIIRNDTVLKTDSLITETTVTVAKMNGFQSAFFAIGMTAVAAVIFILLIKLFKFLKL